MDFELTEEQRSLRQSVVEFARRELNEDVVQRDKMATFSREAWTKCADLGLLGLPVPKEYGGVGADALTTVLALEALGYACTDNGLVFSLNAQMWACETPIVHFGSDEQKRRYLPGLCDGSLVAAHGMSEPGSGSDAFGLATTAERTDGGYVLNGTKTFVTNAPEADLHPRVRDHRPRTRLRRDHRVPGRQGNARSVRREAALEDGPAHVTDERGLPRGLRGSPSRPCSASPGAAWPSSTRR